MSRRAGRGGWSGGSAVIPSETGTATAAMSSFAAAAVGTEANNVGTATAAFSSFAAAAAGSEINNLGTAGAAVSSFAAALVGTYTAPFVPTDISGCKLWLKASTGVTQSSNQVTGWADQSGNGNDQATVLLTPTYSATGAPGTNGPTITSVRADPDTMLQAAAIISVQTAYTICAAFKFTSTTNSMSFIQIGHGDANGMHLGRDSGGKRAVTFPGGGSRVASSATTSNEIWVHRYRVSDHTATLLVNNVDDPMANSANPSAPSATTYVFSLKAPPDCTLYELIAYDSYISDANATSVATYLNGKYSIY